MSYPQSRAARLGNWIERTNTYGALLVIVALLPLCVPIAAMDATKEWWGEVVYKWQRIQRARRGQA